MKIPKRIPTSSVNTTSCDDSDCDSRDCEADFYDGTYFVYCAEDSEWDISTLRSRCLSMGYDGLATVRNESENTFLSDFAPTPDGFIIGGNDVASEGTWVWDSGDPMSFINWASGEPNNAGGEEHCLEMYGAGNAKGGLWNDMVCSVPRGTYYACELR